jgi:UDP-N-acetylglucosamine diphosphorylase/glucosamine-1-phosphate N-acetyltransferase
MAAGKGKRMESEIPKVLHLLAGRPFIDYVLDAASVLHADMTVAIIGHKREQVRDHLDGRGVQFVVQDPPLGTGHAVLQAEPVLAGFVGDIVVLSGDVPLIQRKTLARLIEIHQQRRNAATVLTTIAENPTGYGRIVRDEAGAFKGIVEEREASAAIRQITEVNSGVYVFDSTQLFDYLKQVRPDNRKGEYYLTDLIEIMIRSGRHVEAHSLADFWEVRGINTKQELRDAEREYQAMAQGSKNY